MRDTLLIKRYGSAQEAALGLSHSTYTGTVEGANAQQKRSASIEKYKSAQEAAFGLSHSTYSGTVETANALKR